jgi:hypothetical protein
MPDEATKVRTIVTLFLFAVWATALLGPAFGVSRSINTQVLLAMTALVFLLVGHLWGLEVEKVLGALDGVSLQVDQQRDDDEDDQ